MSGVHTVASRHFARRPKLPPVISLQMAELVVRGDLEQRDRFLQLLSVRGWPATALAVTARLSRPEVARILRAHEEAPSAFREPTAEEIERVAGFEAPGIAGPDRGGRLLKRKRDDTAGVPRELVEELRELKPLATISTGRTKAYAEEAERYSALLWLLHSPKEIGGYGLSLARVARIVDQSATAVKWRLIRYGHLPDTTRTHHPGAKPIDR